MKQVLSRTKQATSSTNKSVENPEQYNTRSVPKRVSFDIFPQKKSPLFIDGSIMSSSLHQNFSTTTKLKTYYFRDKVGTKI